MISAGRTVLKQGPKPPYNLRFRYRKPRAELQREGQRCSLGRCSCSLESLLEMKRTLSSFQKHVLNLHGGQGQIPCSNSSQRKWSKIKMAPFASSRACHICPQPHYLMADVRVPENPPGRSPLAIIPPKSTCRGKCLLGSSAHL